MEYNWAFFKNSTTGSSESNGVRWHNGNSASGSNHAWQSSWDGLVGNSNNNDGGIGNSRLDYCNDPLRKSLNIAPATGAGAFHASAMQEREKAVGGQFRNPDPLLTCLKLGKRHYFEDDASPPMSELHAAAAKKGRTYCLAAGGPLGPPLVVSDSAPAVLQRCQVEGCESVMANAKEYHRRHKCSRFHAVSEFDESKRSCRRRLAGHNERRRKGSQEQHSLPKTHTQDINMMHVTGTGRHQHFMNSSNCALSLLSSSSSYGPGWNISPSSDDLPTRCSAALRELIAENRASVLACRQLINSNLMESCNNNTYKPDSNRAGHGPSVSGGHVTLDLMQDPESAFGLLSVHDHKASKEGNAEDCSELWKVPLGY
ncbi:hypothetical protein OROMI_013848 [Orobanche minor]